jgi:hypothetical protein
MEFRITKSIEQIPFFNVNSRSATQENPAFYRIVIFTAVLTKDSNCIISRTRVVQLTVALSSILILFFHLLLGL